MQSYTIPTNIKTTKQCLHEAHLMKSKQIKLTKENVDGITYQWYI